MPRSFVAKRRVGGNVICHARAFPIAYGIINDAEILVRSVRSVSAYIRIRRRMFSVRLCSPPPRKHAPSTDDSVRRHAVQSNAGGRILLLLLYTTPSQFWTRALARPNEQWGQHSFGGRVGGVYTHTHTHTRIRCPTYIHNNTRSHTNPLYTFIYIYIYT